MTYALQDIIPEEALRDWEGDRAKTAEIIRLKQAVQADSEELAIINNELSGSDTDDDMEHRNRLLELSRTVEYAGNSTTNHQDTKANRFARRRQAKHTFE